jgi:hypothetical protein
MRHLATTLAILLASSAASGQVDPLRSPGCLAALEALGKAEDAAVAAKAAGSPPGGPGSALAAARRGVGVACLGSADLSPPPARVRQPLAVESSAPQQAVIARPQGSSGAAAPAVPTRPLVTLGACDTAGCWASDGTRVQRQGPLLLGLRGYCTVLGAVLTCP